MVDIERADLFNMLRTRAYQKRKVRLRSGRESDFYIDCKAVTLTREGADLVGSVCARALQDGAHVEAVGGLTLGADPIAMAIALRSSLFPRKFDPFVIRKEPKDHGTEQWIEGPVKPGTPVCIIEDVITTGGSAMKAIDRARAAGLVVQRVLALVDRQEDDGALNILRALADFGPPNMTKRFPTLQAIFKREEFEAP